MAGDGAGIADGSGNVRVGRVGWRRVAIKARVKTLAQWTEVARACVELLKSVRSLAGVEDASYVWKSLAGFGFEA